MESFLKSERAAGTKFEELLDPALFAEAGVELGAVTWPNGVDLAPDAMYDAILEHGKWVIEP